MHGAVAVDRRTGEGRGHSIHCDVLAVHDRIHPRKDGPRRQTRVYWEEEPAHQHALCQDDGVAAGEMSSTMHCGHGITH